MHLSFSRLQKPAVWRRKFAFFPTRVARTSEGRTIFVWLEHFMEIVDDDSKPGLRSIKRRPADNDASWPTEGLLEWEQVIVMAA